MTSSSPEAPTLELRDVALASSLSVVILLTILGNTLIIAAVATTRRLRTVTNYFVVSLAASDLLVGMLVMPLAVAKEVAHGEWLFGSVACEMWISMDIMLCTASILNLCCISLDRYFAITSPLAYVVKRSTRLSLVMIGAVWAVSALITCPPLFGLNDRPQAGNTTDCEYITNPGYVVYSALGSFYIPAIIMVYVYWRIFAVARKRQAVLMEDPDNSKEAAAYESNSSAAGDATVTTNPENPHVTLTTNDAEISVSLPELVSDQTESSRLRPFSLFRTSSLMRTRFSSFRRHRNEHQKRHDEDASRPGDRCSAELTTATDISYHCQYCTSPKEQKSTRSHTIRKKEGYERAAFQRERRVAKSLSLVVGGFIVCWLPFFTVYIIEPFCDSCYFHPILNACLVWLGWLNSAINPFIYAFNSKDFKKAFLRLTIDKCRCCAKPRKGHDPQQFM